MPTTSPLNLVPLPRQIRFLSSRPVRLPRQLRWEGVDKGKARPWVEFWQREILPLLGDTSAGTFVIRLHNSPRTKKPGEAYHLRLDSHPMLESETVEGMWAGLQTLKQLAQDVPPSGRLPSVEIRDWPSARWRGFQVDLARGMSFRPEFYQNLCADLAALKYNFLQLYLEHNFAWEAYPEVAEADALNARQVRELEKTASRWGITIVPAINSCKHMEGFLMHPRFAHLRELIASRDPHPGGQLCPAHPEAWPFVRSLYDELLAAFSGPFFHLGMDEAHFIGRHPRSWSSSPARWFGEHIRRCARYVTQRGRRPIIWGDKFLNAAEFRGKDVDECKGGYPGNICEALKFVPRNTVIADWHYTSAGDASVRHFRKQGFEVWAAAGIHPQSHFVHERQWEVTPRFLANAVNAGATGSLLTSWEWRRGFRIEDHRFTLALAAEAAWRGQAPLLTGFERRWTSLRYGRSLPIIEVTRRTTKPIVSAFNNLSAQRGPLTKPLGEYTRGHHLWEKTDRRDMAFLLTALHGQPSTQAVERAGKVLERARSSLDQLARSAHRNQRELSDLRYYLDLYQHLLDRLTITPVAITRFRAAQSLTGKARARALQQVRQTLEPLYQQALGFFRIQRDLCGRIGCPVDDLHRIRSYLLSLAEAMRKLREAQESGHLPDTFDIFGDAGHLVFTFPPRK